MKKLYTDLFLCPNLNDSKHTLNMLAKVANLGFKQVGIAFKPNCTPQEIKQVQQMCEEVELDLATRVNLNPRTPNDLLSSLRKLRRRFEIVAVTCDSKNVSRQAAKDRRVDLINFSSPDFHKRFFDLAEAELASNALTALEIVIKPLLTTEGPQRARLLSNLRKEAEIAKNFDVPIVISSAVSDEILLRKPVELASLASLFDLDKNTALKAVSQIPQTIVKRNREKLSQNFVAPGIRVVKKGKDC